MEEELIALKKKWQGTMHLSFIEKQRKPFLWREDVCSALNSRHKGEHQEKSRCWKFISQRQRWILVIWHVFSIDFDRYCILKYYYKKATVIHKIFAICYWILRLMNESYFYLSLWQKCWKCRKCYFLCFAFFYFCIAISF